MRRALLPAAALALALAGCGYSTRFSLAERYPSIGIELFANDSPERDIERELHAALARRVRDMVDASLRSPRRAAVVLRGTVQEYRRRSGIRSKDNVQLETGLTIRVEAELYDPRKGVRVAGPVTATTRIGYTLERRQVNESEARARSIDLLAERLVVDLVGRVNVPPAEEVRDPADRADEDRAEDGREGP